MSTAPIRVLVVDDHPVFVASLAATANDEVRERLIGQGASHVCDKSSAEGLIRMLATL
ncbi:MAG TPA: hypothetical protein VMY34_09080 [Acidimicrobiales bacterium]|nr:hypothetical protein [Acidimicrobiales bacterium]